jgi:hypothetical protein
MMAGSPAWDPLTTVSWFIAFLTLLASALFGLFV